DLDQFRSRLLVGNHTVKRALTDPDLFSGIGNAYSDEILHRAKMSPVRMTRAMDDEEVKRLFAATREIMQEWIDSLRREANDRVPQGHGGTWQVQGAMPGVRHARAADRAC